MPMLDKKSLRLVIVGASAAVLFFVLNYLLLHLGGAPFVSSVVAYGLSFIYAYTAQQRWTFGGQHSHGRALPRYLAAQVFCALLSGLVSHVTSTFGAPPSVISIAAMLAGSAASFVLVRFWVFSETRNGA